MREQQRRLSADALVEALATADTQSVPKLLEQSAVAADRIRPLIAAQLGQARVFDGEWLNLSIAELTLDRDAPFGQLLAYLPEARPAELAAIVNVLADRGTATEGLAWQLLLADSATDDQRLRLACLAARLSPSDECWSRVATPVARALVHQHPLDLAAFTSALQSARAVLTPAIVDLLRAGKLEPAARRTALSIVARYATEQVATLVDLAVAAEPDEFALVFPALERRAEAAVPLLREIAGTNVNIEALADPTGTKSAHEIEVAYDLVQNRRATAAVALWRLGEPSSVMSALPRGGDPALRAWLMELLLPLGIPPETILAEIESATDPGTRQALVLALGQLP
jgi:hypothetical protein